MSAIHIRVLVHPSFPEHPPGDIHSPGGKLRDILMRHFFCFARMLSEEAKQKKNAASGALDCVSPQVRTLPPHVQGGWIANVFFTGAPTQHVHLTT